MLMGAFGGALGQADFQEPSSPDTTSAPQMDQTPQQQPLSPGAQKIAGALSAAKKKKSGPVGPTIKKPSDLTAAIARGRRARQGGMKYG